MVESIKLKIKELEEAYAKMDFTKEEFELHALKREYNAKQVAFSQKVRLKEEALAEIDELNKALRTIKEHLGIEEPIEEIPSEEPPIEEEQEETPIDIDTEVEKEEE